MPDDLVYDVGLHRGEDSAYYLRKGYRVVAFEADPDLVRRAQQRFAAELSTGRLEIIEGAISESDADTIAFYRHRNPQATALGTTCEAWVERNRAAVDQLDVPVVRFHEHLERTGTPHYMKIDIEGADRLCIDTLLRLGICPTFISLESEKVDFSLLRAELDALERLGFDRFAAVQQWGMATRVVQARDRQGDPFTYRYEAESSGGFGDDIHHWMNRSDIERRYRAIFRRYRLLGDGAAINRSGVGFRLRHEVSQLLRKPLPGWYDTHATRSA
jgi:FkbM family methyltransferase